MTMNLRSIKNYPLSEWLRRLIVKKKTEIEISTDATSRVKNEAKEEENRVGRFHGKSIR